MPDIFCVVFDHDIQITVKINNDRVNRTRFRAFESEICVGAPYPEPMKFKPVYKFRQYGVTNTQTPLECVGRQA